MTPDFSRNMRSRVSLKSEPAFTGYAVGIGASAGGLEALEIFFQHCPIDTNVSFFVIQHLSPDHKSMMGELLARRTKMKVVVVEDEMSIAPNIVYLIPPGVTMRIVGGKLRLTPKSAHGLTLPIDIFFTSLADSFANRAIGIVLSGTGSDGTRGAVEINAAGGYLMAQDPRQAKFDGMPQSVIATSIVDAILPAEELPDRLLKYVLRLPHLAKIELPVRPPGSEMGADEAFEAILDRLNKSSGIDFQNYKPATVLRRIERRMQVNLLTSLGQYLDFFEADTGEQFALRRELLISVTSFFRDTDAFDLLATKLVPEIVAACEARDTIRVWCAACSTGEEAYSLAILFLEAFEHAKRWPKLKIFATDVSQQNIEIAGSGQYPESAAAEVTQARLERFFSRTGNSCTVKPELRQCVVFACHNLLTDPPFTRVDLVSCRNALIYFRPDAQARVLRRLQYAVKPDGFLFLGPSESLAGNDAGFATWNAKHKVFKRTGSSPPLTFEARTQGGATRPAGASRSSPELLAKVRLGEGLVVDHGITGLLEAYAPPAILINERQEAVHMFGDLQPYCRFRSGSASLEVSRILLDPLVPVAAALSYKAVKSGEIQISDILTFATAEGARSQVRLVARPLKLARDERRLLLCFEPYREVGDREMTATLDVGAETVARVGILESELLATRESLQATIEELETTNEELQATNEELMASNEELQSSNEELQSVNEELNTVNAEYQENMGLLARTNSDLDSLAKAVGIASVFVDRELKLTRFSPEAMMIFKLRDFDLGRPLDEITHNLLYPTFVADLQRTMANGLMVEHEVTAANNKHYLVRILPYAVPSTPERGAVATFIDVSSFRDVDRLQAIIDALPEHIAVLERDATIAIVNQSWRRFAEANGDLELKHTGPGVNYFANRGIAMADDFEQRAIRGFAAVVAGTAPVFSMQYPCHSPTEKRWFVMNIAPVPGHGYAAVVSHFNISSWYEAGAEAERATAERELPA